jgi:hypothetical protein
MNMPSRQEQIPNVQSNNQYLQAPGAGQSNDVRDNSANRLNNNASRGSLNNSNSAQKIVEEKHLGP